MATLKYERTGTLSAVGTRSADLVDKNMDKYLKIEEETPVHMMQFFRKEVPETTNFKLTSVGSELGMPWITSDTDPVPYDSVAPGYSKDWDVVTYQLAIAVTDLLVQYDRSGQIPFIMSGLPKSFRKLYEYLMANVLETAAATSCADGVNGFSASHPHRRMGSPVWSNLETGAALSTTSMNSMWTNIANRKDATGFPRFMRLKKLIVPTALRQAAVHICDSDKVPESDVNATNVNKGMQFEVCETLTSSATAWYGVGSLPEQEWGLHLVEWQAPTIHGLPYDTAAPLVKKRYFGYCRVVAGMSIPSNLHYNAGA